MYGVDPDTATDNITTNTVSTVDVVSCVHRGNTVHVTFAGTDVPTEIHLFKQRRPVRARLSRPFQCARCGVYGHATTTCSTTFPLPGVFESCRPSSAIRGALAAVSAKKLLKEKVDSLPTTTTLENENYLSSEFP